MLVTKGMSTRKQRRPRGRRFVAVTISASHPARRTAVLAMAMVPTTFPRSVDLVDEPGFSQGIVYEGDLLSMAAWMFSLAQPSEELD